MKTLFCPYCSTWHFIRASIETDAMRQCMICYRLMDSGEIADCETIFPPSDWQVTFKPHRFVTVEQPVRFQSCCQRHATLEAFKRLYGHLSAMQMGVQGTSPVAAFMDLRQVYFITARFMTPTDTTISGVDGHYFKLEKL